MSREVLFNNDVICDRCGKPGAFDFMGDCFCGNCIRSCKECDQVFILNKDEAQELCWECLEK